MRALVIGDPHFREGCVREMETFTEQCLKIVREHLSEIDFIVVLGDIMDRHGILHQKPFHQSCKFLLDLAGLRKTYCLIGNHDFDVPSKYLPENHPYKVMVWNEVPNLHVIERPRIEGNILFSPYVPPGDFPRAVFEALGREPCRDIPVWEELGGSGVGLVFAHQEFLGCQMGRLKSEVGDPWSMEPFGKHPFVVSGHIHDHQWVGENILYTGTPIQVNYGEGRKKGLCLLEVEFSESGLPISHSERWFEIQMPRKIVQTLLLDSLDAWVAKRFENLLSRYSLTARGSEKRRKAKKGEEGFDTILNLHAQKNEMGELRERVAEDRLLDRVRLQVLVPRDRQTTAKGIVSKLKDLPLGLQGVFTNEATEGGVGISRPPSEEARGKTWLQILEERVENNVSEKLLLTEILKDLLQKG